MELNPATIKAIAKDSGLSDTMLRDMGYVIQDASQRPVEIWAGIVDENDFENILYAVTLRPSGILDIMIDVASYVAVTKGLAKMSSPFSAFDIYAAFMTQIDFAALSPNITTYTPLGRRFARWRQKYMRQHQWRIVSPHSD